MKVAILTANFGGFDKEHSVIDQSLPCDQYYFTEHNSPFPLRGLDNRMMAKYFKLQPHRFLTDYDVFIWHDASISIESPHFAKHMLSLVDDGDITISRHYKRPNIEEELLFILDGIMHRDPYLCSRYFAPPIQAELDFIRRENMCHLPLYACGLFAFWNNEVNRKRMDDWWEKTVQYSVLDQCMFSCAFRHAHINPFAFNEPYDLGLLKKHQHNEGY